jgi:hypothetical protein
MSRLRTAVVMAIVSALTLSAAAPPTGWTPYIWYRDLQAPVEQQTPGGATQKDRNLWVVNRTECVWDADDKISGALFGRRLPPGESASMSICIIGDWTGHLIGAKRSDPQIAVTLSLDGIISVPLLSDRACILGPDYDHDAGILGLLQPIAGSNGGIGAMHTATITVKNMRPKGNLQDGAVNFIVEWSGSDAAQYCPHGDPRTNWGGAYPLRWWWDR